MERIGDPHSTTVPPIEDDDDGNKSMVGSKNPRNRTPPTNIDALPEELLSEVLVRVPAEDIHDRARFVCKKWCRTIHRRAFEYAHLHRTGYGLLLAEWLGCRSSFVAATQGGGIEVSEFKSSPFITGLTASCNGLIMGIYLSGEHDLYVLNPATKGCFVLPPVSNTASSSKSWENRYGIAYSAASMEYKVVTTYRSDGNPFLTKCDVLTVGVDNTWRHLATQQLSPEANQLLSGHPLITEGFMHWASSFGNDVLTLNVETEVFAETPAPLPPIEYAVPPFQYSYMSTGRNLSVLFPCGNLMWEVWEMKGETGEWRKLLPNIDCNSKIQQLGGKDDVFLEPDGWNVKSKTQEVGWEDDVSLIPVGWVRYPEVLLFFSSLMINRSCIIYKLDKGEMDSVKLPFPMGALDIKALVHKNSLVCLS